MIAAKNRRTPGLVELHFADFADAFAVFFGLVVGAGGLEVVVDGSAVVEDEAVALPLAFLFGNVF